MEEKYIDRFWKKVSKTDHCWIWTGWCNPQYGHGQFRYEGKLLGAHVFSYMLHNNVEKPKLFVRHTCDNPPCVNPSHLLLGTHGDNMQDMVDRGRHKTHGVKECKRGHPLEYWNLLNTGKQAHCLSCKYISELLNQFRRKGVSDAGARTKHKLAFIELSLDEFVNKYFTEYMKKYQKENQ